MIKIEFDVDQIIFEIDLPFYFDSILLERTNFKLNTLNMIKYDLEFHPNSETNHVLYNDDNYSIWLNNGWIRIFFKQNATELCINNRINTRELVERFYENT